jgi:hypothetical protein
MTNSLLTLLVAPILILGADRRPDGGIAHQQGIASHQLKVHEVARIEERIERDREGSDVRRITIVATVVEKRREGALDMSATKAGLQPGDLIVIDYTVDVAQRERDRAAAKASKPPAEILFEPDPPELDAKGEFWAHLAPAGGRLGNVNRHAGRRVQMETPFKGPVFVPVAAQYSFVTPARE